MMYNAKGEQIHTMAQEMMRDTENQIAHFRSLQHDLR